MRLPGLIGEEGRITGQYKAHCVSAKHFCSIPISPRLEGLWCCGTFVRTCGQNDVQALHPLSLISARLIHVSGRAQHIKQIGSSLDNRDRPKAYRLIQLFGVLAVFTQIGSELLRCIAVPAGLGDTY